MEYPEKIRLEYNTIDIGGLYRFSEQVQIGFMAKNFIEFSTRSKYDSFSLPYYLTVGISKTSSRYTMSLESEHIFGTFGGLVEKDARIWFLRAGFERGITSRTKIRLGIIYPVIAKTSTIGNIRDDMPSPKAGGSIGLGVKYRSFTLDFSIFGDPMKSYLKQKVRFSSVVSITMHL